MSGVAEELAGLELGDVRRNHRLIKLVDDLAAHPTTRIPLASGGWAETKAAYRWLNHPALDWRDRLEVHPVRTGERLPGQPVVLCRQDTTELDFSRQPGIAGLGRLRYAAPHGLSLHPPLVVTPEGMACQIPFNLAASRGIQRPGGCLKMGVALQQNVEHDVGIVDNAFHRYFSSR